MQEYRAPIRAGLGLFMTDNIVLMPTPRETTLSPEIANGYTELLVQTISLLDKHIGLATDKLDASLASEGPSAIGTSLGNTECVL